MGPRIHIRRAANQRGMGYTAYMPMAPSKHRKVQKRIRKDSSGESNARGAVKVSKEELVSISLTTMPPTTNSMYKPFGGRFHVDTKARDAKEAMAWEARAQYKGEPWASELIVEVALTWPTRRNHDVDNIKSLLDCLKGILWIDDGQIVDLRITKKYEKGVQGVKLTMRPA